MLVRIFYVSEVVGTVTTADIAVILSGAQVRNRRLDVTGLLAQSDGHFAQALEGRREAVQEVMASVLRDRRHARVRVLIDEPIRLRRFSRWSMALIRRDDMADVMRELHETGRCDRRDLHDVIDELLTYEA